MKFLPLIAALVLLVAVGMGQARAACEYDVARVTEIETKDGSIAVPLNVVETASLVEGLRALYPDGHWSRDVENSVAYILQPRNIVRIVYFKGGCAKMMTDVPLTTFMSVVKGTAPKKTGVST